MASLDGVPCAQLFQVGTGHGGAGVPLAQSAYEPQRTKAGKSAGLEEAFCTV